MKVFKLWPHQEVAVAEARKALIKEKRVIVAMPTGSGKTVTASYIASEMIKRKNGSLLIVCHRIEILQQFAKTLMSFGIHPAFIVAGKPMPMAGHGVYLGMVETLNSRLGTMQERFFHHYNIKLVIADEVHWGSYEKMVNMIPCHVLGLSATPKATKGRALHTYFNACIVPVKKSDLFATKHLVIPKTFSIKHDFAGLKLKNGEFTEKSLLEEFSKPVLYDGVVEQYLRHSKGRKFICFNVNIQHSLQTLERFNEAGISCRHVDGTTPKNERQEIFEGFARGDFLGLLNVSIATTGFDEPSVTCVIVNRATAELTLNEQMNGRGARKHEEKQDFHIIDMGKNYLRHGKFEQDIDWLSIFHNPALVTQRNEVQSKDHKECRECGAVIQSSITFCPYCGETYSKKEVEEHFLEHATTEEIREYKMQNMPLELRGLKVRDMTYNQLIKFAEHMNYQNAEGWAGVQMKLKRRRR